MRLYLVPLFLWFAKAHPDVKLVIDERKTSRIIKGLRRGEIDLGILVRPVDLPDIEEVALFREPFLAYLPEGHPLRKRRRVQRSDLREQALWVLSEGHCFREQTLSLCDRPSAGGHDNVLYESGSIETLKQLVRNGSGMTLVPELSVTPDDPHVRRFNTPEPVREVSLVMRRPFVRRSRSARSPQRSTPPCPNTYAAVPCAQAVRCPSRANAQHALLLPDQVKLLVVGTVHRDGCYREGHVHRPLLDDEVREQEPFHLPVILGVAGNGEGSFLGGLHFLAAQLQAALHTVVLMEDGTHIRHHGEFVCGSAVHHIDASKCHTAEREIVELRERGSAVL
ncbi:MAG: hypothetical protein IPH53_08475 [Flavobacteriales bacterium]|nr:hypothetical protein [Flavobacteriales bacterium]